MNYVLDVHTYISAYNTMREMAKAAADKIGASFAMAIKCRKIKT